MNIRDFQYIISIAKHSHFGKAAEECNVSQPALSMQIQKLESAFGVKIFERNNKHVMVTDIGRKIIERAKNIIDETQRIDELIKIAKDPEAVEIRIGAFPTLAPYFLPVAIPKITKNFPKLKIFLIEEKTEVLIKKLLAGEIDTAFLATPLPMEIPTIEHSVLFEDEFLLAVPPSHKFAGNKVINRNELSGESLLLMDDGHCLREQALDICSLIGAREKEQFRATSLETLRQMVIANVGITLIPKIAVRENDTLVYIPFHKPPPKRTISMVWRSSSVKKELLLKIMQSLM
ncbi:MAG: LysR substrate-binding domain-containing protein [Rickettsiales bacterium]|nr:LysR substrate-binding domain-containing protein [Pseudomonadota bacterium]MDA0966477.1 LysR substrate-binding domain-containing protein [Pseudomonadota bacterium]MDG4543339.1 LysR substrate-binding domain-containing protein [Rickettsiales bacterium]MDG4545605.1 LysR substrate-binding domain-containing protein [Rickettsiales bacterium]MDG4548054.1 LysR substrate-binding domain-containing protein [Rickettsiales bacterium]